MVFMLNTNKKKNPANFSLCSWRDLNINKRLIIFFTSCNSKESGYFYSNNFWINHYCFRLSWPFLSPTFEHLWTLRNYHILILKVTTKQEKLVILILTKKAIFGDRTGLWAQMCVWLLQPVISLCPAFWEDELWNSAAVHPWDRRQCGSRTLKPSHESIFLIICIPCF